ncbi:hypothetical protein D3C80_2072450 [compost metagenome]
MNFWKGLQVDTRTQDSLNDEWFPGREFGISYININDPILDTRRGIGSTTWDDGRKVPVLIGSRNPPEVG